MIPGPTPALELLTFGRFHSHLLLLDIIMARRLPCILVAMGFFLAIAEGQEGGKQGTDKLRGIWQVTKMIDSSENAGTADEIKEFTLEFIEDAGLLRKRKGDDGRSEKYSLDPAKKPKWIDIGVRDGEPHGQGIYKLEGDELTICIVSSTNSKNRTPRPSEFKASKQGHTLMVLKKAKQ